MKKLSFLLVTSLLFTLYFSCSKDKASAPMAPDCSGVNDSVNTYSDTISYILNNYCAYAGCHDAATAQKGVILSEYSTTVEAFKNNNAICSITHEGCLAMPYQMPQLDSNYIKYLVCWASNGYPQ